MRFPVGTSLRSWSGALFHAAGGPLLYLLWRFTGLSGGDGIGLLLPLAWLLAGAAYGRGGVPRHSPPLLALHLLLALLWTSGGPMPTLAKASAVGALLPGLAAMAQNPTRRLGPVLALLPLLPLAVLTVPISGDEPFHASIAEQTAFPDGERFSEFAHQRGDPNPGLTHHQPLFPLLLAPGYPLGIPGMRGVSAAMALGTAAILALLLRRSGLPDWRLAVFLGLLTLPGIGVLGTLYPIWAALPVFLAAALHGMKTRSFLWMILATILLTLIKIRFAALGVGLLTAVFLEFRGRRRLLILLLCLAGPLLLLAADGIILGGRIFWIRYGNEDTLRSLVASLVMRPAEVLCAVPGALLDVEAGLLWKSPWVILALAGIPRFRREQRRLFRWLGLPAAFYLASLFLWVPTDWHGAPSPVGRMLMPAVPFLLASMTMTLRNRSAGLLVALSLGVSALIIASPGLRFNDADGTDRILTLLLGSGSPADALLPSLVRPALLPFLLFGGAAAILVRMTAVNRGSAAFVLLPAALLVGAAARMSPTSWEAEDLGPSMVSGCDYHPVNADPFERKFWFDCKQLFLTLAHPGDEVRVPVPAWDSDSVTLRVTYRTLIDAEEPWMLVECLDASDTLRLRSDPLDLPARILYVTGGDRDLRAIGTQPGHMQELTGEITFSNPGAGTPILLKPLNPSETESTGRILLDRLEFIR